MNREAILRELKETQEHNLSCYSRNYLNEKPKDGYEKEWQEAKEKLQIVIRMLDELPHRVYDRENDTTDTLRVFYGSVDGYATSMTHTQDSHRYITKIDFGVDDGDNGHSGDIRYLFEIDHQLGIDWFISGRYDIERHTRYDEGKGDMVKITVDNINVIRKIEWVEKDE